MNYMERVCPIAANEPIGPGFIDLTVQSADMARAAACGQFVNIRCGAKTLRRPISICEIGEDTLRLVYEVKGEGTAWLSQRKAGENLEILGPLGQGFKLKNAPENAVLIGGGIGTPPMLQTAKALKNPTAILGFRTRNLMILADDFAAACGAVHICTDDGSFGHHGFATDVLKQKIAEGTCGLILACGPIPMLKNVAAIAEENGIPCQVSLEQRMGCGIGACLTCACKNKNPMYVTGNAHVCKNGPVFNAKEVIWK